MFQEDFKYYKKKSNKPSFENVLDFTNDNGIKQNKNISQIKLSRNISNADPTVNLSYFLKPIEKWSVYEVKDRPGLVFIKNPFTALGQRYWTVRSLRDYSQRPNKNKLDNPSLLSADEDWWTVMNDSNTDVDRKKRLLKKMRWVTLGYHHNWTTKEYDYENKNQFPDDLFNLCKHITKVLSIPGDYRAEAAIMNFYREGDTLSGHVDHSEPNKLAPLISLSFGQSCIFLLGGTTRDVKPTAIRLNSGDICILSEQARLCYHAVPLILKTDERPWENVENEETASFTDEDLFSNKIDVKTYENVKDDAFFKLFGSYINECRINLNVRQVLTKKA